MEWLYAVFVIAIMIGIISLIWKLMRDQANENVMPKEDYPLYTSYYLPLVNRLEQAGNRKALDVLSAALEQAKAEICADPLFVQVIENTRRFHSSGNLTATRFLEYSQEKQIEFVLTLGFSDVNKSTLYCVSISESIPFTDAITLLVIAERDPKAREQTVDVGNWANPGILQSAVDCLAPCNPDWSCNVVAFCKNSADKVR